MAFDAPKWIFVGDLEECAHSKKQVEICKSMKLPLKGAILCNDKDHAESEACVKVPAFPCFCNVESHLCVAGLRETSDQFDALQKLSDDEKVRKQSQNV